jgi:ABC-type cobalt transport system substrate-binding protein
MKKADIAMIILIASASILISYFVARAIFNNISSDTVKVKTIDKIEATITPPSDTIFNPEAINPSVEVQINSTSTDSGTQ